MDEIRVQKPAILVVNDSPDDISSIVDLLNGEYEIRTATSAEKALAYLENHSEIDLILLDIVMPDMDGFELCKKIKQRPELSSIAVVFLTALEKESDIVKGLELGAADYIVKPFEPQVLKARVKTHIDLKRFHDNVLYSLKKSEALLLQQTKLATLGEMFENIAHQWKQPLCIISLTSVTLRITQELGTLKSADLGKSLDQIESSVRHLSQTINDFSSFAKEQKEKVSFDLHELVEKTLKLLLPKLHTRGIEVSNTAQNIELFSYENDLMQVMMNIISNAIDALERQSTDKRITIDSRADEGLVMISVCDNGGGVDSAFTEEIFEKYFTTNADKENSGLGLFMSRKIMQERLGGEVSVKNQSEGACFTLSMPLSKEE